MNRDYSCFFQEWHQKWLQNKTIQQKRDGKPRHDDGKHVNKLLHFNFYYFLDMKKKVIKKIMTNC